MNKYFLKTSMLSVAVALTLGTVGCSSGGGGDGDATSVELSGNAVDGYLRNATVCYDLDNNLVCDSGEPSAITGDDGSFDLTVTPAQQTAAVPNAALLVVGDGNAIDIDTNLPFVGVLRAPFEDTDVINVTPLTTMASAIVSSGGSIDEAYQQVADALGIDESLVAADPVAVATTNPEVIEATMTVQRIVEVLAAATVADDNTTSVNDAINDIYVALADAVAEVADDNTTSGMADIIEAAAADANSTLTDAAVAASVVASIIEEQVSEVLEDGYNPDDALVVDEAVEVIEEAVVTAVEDDTPIDTATVEDDADDAAAAADPVLIAVENLLEAYGITADATAMTEIKGNFTESSQVTAASVSALTGLTAQAVIDELALAYRTEQVETYIANLGQSVSNAAIAEIVALSGFDATMTTAEFSALIYATGNSELMKLSLTVSPPAGYATLSDVDQAKALFTELRTQAMSVVDYEESGTPGYLDTEAVSMDAALNGVVLDTSYVAGMLDNIINNINEAMEDNRTTSTMHNPAGTRSMTLTQNTALSDISWSYEMNETESGNHWSGTLTYPDIDDSFDPSSFTTLTVNIEGTLPLDYEPVTTGEEDSQSFDGSVTVTKTSTGVDISIEGSIASNGDSLVLSNATAEIAYDTDAETGEPTLEYFKFNGLTLEGTVDGYTIDGTLTVNSYAQNTLLAVKGGMYEVEESGIFVELRCVLPEDRLYINGPVTFTYGGETYTPDYTDVYDNNAFYGFNEINSIVEYSEIPAGLNYDISCSDGHAYEYEIHHVWNDSWMDIANSGWLPNDITFSGAITNTVTDGAITGELNAQWLNVVTMDLDDDSQEPLVNVTLDGTLSMPSRPEMALYIGFENSATQNTIEATYAYDTTGVSVNGVFDSEMENGDIVIEAATTIRAEIAIVDKEIDYENSSVTKGGLVLGTVEESVAGVPVIKYIDGTFESLP